MADIVKAKDRIANVAVRTPLVESPALSKALNRQVYLKLECFQPIRVFKIRGAYNKISQVSEDSVVAVSSGNHGGLLCENLGQKEHDRSARNGCSRKGELDHRVRRKRNKIRQISSRQRSQG